MSLYFITGTDTECGKTTATSLLAEHFTKQNKNTITQKWIQTGAAENHNDIDEHLKYLKLSKQEHDMFIKHMCPYKFKLASSAHLAAKKENRLTMPNTRFLIHQPLIRGGIQGQASDIQIHANEIGKTREKINKLLSEECGQDLAQVEKDTDRDYWMNADEAIKYGLVTRGIKSHAEL